MYKIGEFSRMVSFSVKTLRYYQEIGLLEPVSTDEETGYRYYDGASYDRARKIHLLKGFHFSLMEIKEIIDEIETAADLQVYLKEKHTQMEDQIQSLKKEQEKLLQAMVKMEEKHMARSYEVREKTIEDMLVASIRYKGRYDQMGQYIGELFKVVKGAASGPMFALYHDETYMEEGADIEVCVPVKKQVSGKEVTCRTLPGGRYLSTLHVGPYEALCDGYKALSDYQAEKGLKTVQPSREVYLKGPGMLLKGNPEKYETELLYKLV